MISLFCVTEFLKVKLADLYGLSFVFHDSSDNIKKVSAICGEFGCIRNIFKSLEDKNLEN